MSRSLKDGRRPSPGLFRTIVIICAGVVSNVAAAASLPEDMSTMLEQEGLAGAVWATVDHGQITTDAAGYANMADRTPMESGARVHVGSVAKSLIATGILHLASKGRIDLDAPIAGYMPGLPIHNPWASQSRVTVRHLLDHTSGFDDARLWQMFSTDISPDTPLLQAFKRSPQVLTARVRPGTRFSYSNSGYALLGLLIETITGDRYENYLDTHLLRPLGMTSSTFHFTTQLGATADMALAWGHVDGGKPVAAQPVMLRPAGQFTTTAADMARYATFLISDGTGLMSEGTGGGEMIIAPGLMAARGVPHTTEARWNGLMAGYGLGMSTYDRFGAVGKCHSGNILGFASMLCVYPAEQKAFFVSLNTDSETADYSRLYARVAAALDLMAPAIPDSDLPIASAKNWEGYHILAPSRFDSFRLLDVMFNYQRLNWNSGKLVMTPANGKPRSLRPIGERLLSADDRNLASHVLMLSEDDKPLISDGFRTYEKVNPALIFGLWASAMLCAGGMAWLLACGSVAFMKHGANAIRRTEGMAFIGIASLLVPTPLFLAQPLMALGDMTVASMTLAAASVLLPVSMLAAHTKVIQTKNRSRMETFHGLATIAVFQFCLILWYWDLMPLTLWR
ncbi:serine hydrolase domain-containing protein [Kordiimonas aestuarii]|uniref:serine hydrolase domain-containing protein n=1 Tax=Kordiimonas aestuarii TaxID=1005925 RepID=UPI0021CEDA85|nr:serine hydrolase domain-containing protein [Kordiimonas aestuarii]